MSKLQHQTEPQPPQVRVHFRSLIPPDDIPKEIKQTHHQQIVMWYVGTNGLKEESVVFHREKVIGPIYQEMSDAEFWLMDLTGWGAFKDLKKSYNKKSSFCKKIAELHSERLHCISAADVFSELLSLSDTETVNQIRSCCLNSRIFKKSKSFEDRGFTVKDVFGERCLALDELMKLDIAKAYAPIQYLEGIILVSMIVNQCIIEHTTKSIHITFVLPNDEYEYYAIGRNQFQKDVEAFLLSSINARLSVPNIDITFISYKYGSIQQDRPYNCANKTVNIRRLSFEDITGKKKSLEGLQFTTERLFVRPYQPSDYDAAVTIYGDCHLTKYFDYGKPKSKTEVNKIIAHYTAATLPFLGLFTVFDKRTMELVGFIDAASILIENQRFIEIGYIFRHRFHNSGFCTEALRGWLKASTKKMQDSDSFVGLLATVHPENIPSIKVLEKLGMKRKRKIKRFNATRIEYRLEFHDFANH
jgi:ribosomal-protein-alanine N-acetyltransferase